jgi:hypothetical protein
MKAITTQKIKSQKNVIAMLLIFTSILNFIEGYNNPFVWLIWWIPALLQLVLAYLLFVPDLKKVKYTLIVLILIFELFCLMVIGGQGVHFLFSGYQKLVGIAGLFLARVIFVVFGETKGKTKDSGKAFDKENRMRTVTAMLILLAGVLKISSAFSLLSVTFSFSDFFIVGILQVVLAGLIYKEIVKVEQYILLSLVLLFECRLLINSFEFSYLALDKYTGNNIVTGNKNQRP